MPAMGRKNALLGRIRVSSALARSTHRPPRLVAYDFASSGIQPGAWMICPPTRRNYRTAALGSCAERRFQDRQPLISEARAPKHTPRSPSSSAYIHYEPTSLSPLAEAVVHAHSRAIGVRPCGSDLVCARSAPRHQRCLRSRNRHTDVILGLVPRTHRAAYSLSRHGARHVQLLDLHLASKPRGTLYVGVTNGLIFRVEQHRAGKGSAFTRKYRVHMLVWYEEFADVRERSSARRPSNITRAPGRSTSSSVPTRIGLISTPRCPVLLPSQRFSLADGWILGTRPRMTVECVAGALERNLGVRPSGSDTICARFAPRRSTLFA